MIVYSSGELDGEHHYLDPQPYTTWPFTEYDV